MLPLSNRHNAWQHTPGPHTSPGQLIGENLYGCLNTLTASKSCETVCAHENTMIQMRTPAHYDPDEHTMSTL